MPAKAGKTINRIPRKLPKRAKEPITTHVAIVLDRSGSMAELGSMPQEAYNEQLATLKSLSSNGHRTKLTTIYFDTECERLHESADVHSVEPMRNYCPRGLTAYFDATWQAINAVEKAMPKKGKDAALVVVISDGLENCSREVTRGQLAKRVEALEKTGRWTFSYAGGASNKFEAKYVTYIGTTSAGMTISNGTMWVGSQGLASFSSSMASCLNSYYALRGVGVQAVVNVTVAPEARK